MKIIHIITRLDKGGSAENVLTTCEYFAFKKTPVKNDYEIILIYGGQQKLQIIDHKLQIKNYYIKELQRSISPKNDFIAFIKIFNIIKKEKPDIVHTHSSKAGILGRWATFLYNCKLQISDYKLRKAKIIHTPHGHIFYGYYNKFITTIFILIEKVTSIFTDKLVALTVGEKNESLAFGVGKPNQWVIIHSGIDYRLQITDYKFKKIKDEFNIKDNDLVIGTVARLEPIKGVEYFIDAVKIITDHKLQITNLKFIIVGDGNESEKLKVKSEKLKINDKVIFTGMREDVVDIMSIMDIYVQPSVNEGMGKTIIMASMLGKPIVATKVQGIPSVIIDNKTGLLVPSKNSKKLAEAIIKLIKNKNLRLQMGQNAKIFVNQIIDGYPKFSIERMIYLLEKLYNEWDINEI